MWDLTGRSIIILSREKMRTSTSIRSIHRSRSQISVIVNAGLSGSCKFIAENSL